MDELMDLLTQDEPSSSQISDHIKDILFQKSAANIDAVRPSVSASLFGDDVDFDAEPSAEFESDVDFDSEEDEVEAG
jgi:hypothetical protein